jgi:hypothetical protein
VAIPQGSSSDRYASPAPLGPYQRPRHRCDSKKRRIRRAQPPFEQFAIPALKGAKVRGYGRVDSAEGLDRALEITKELERLHTVLMLRS